VAVAAVLPCGDAPHPFVAALEADGVCTFRIHVRDRDYYAEQRAIRVLCRQRRPDVVHTHGFRSDVIAGTVVGRDGIAIVSTCHGFIESDWRGRMYQWLQRRALRRFDAIIAVSRATEERLRLAGVAASKIHFVPNGYAGSVEILSRDSARRILDLPEAPVIGWVGRLSVEKGPDLAIEAFARLRHPTACLVFIGSGRDAGSLRTRTVALGVSERVLWRNAVPEAGKLFSAFDVFLLSSRTEGTPIALLEAMAATVPIVATRVGGVPDVIDASSAHLVASGDVDAMAVALADVLSQPDAARARAVRARERLDERFAVEPWLSRYESIYRSVLR
jgi:glycosyltransferase involved in cell wall biosynthesis